MAWIFSMASFSGVGRVTADIGLVIVKLRLTGQAWMSIVEERDWYLYRWKGDELSC